MISSASLGRPAAGKPLAMALAIGTLFSLPTAFAQDRKLESVVVTANRTPQIATEVLNDNITITSEDIVRSGRTSLVDLLQRQRGIEIVRNGGPATNSSVYLRGTDTKQNIVLIDGVRVGSATSGGANWAGIPLSQIDRVEIVYGPLSTMYGADAVGGVIQIFTKKGDGPPAPTVSAGVGSDRTYNLEAGVSGSSNGFRYALRAAHEESDGFSSTRRGASGFNADRDGYDSNSASGQFSLELAKGHEIGVNFLHSDLESQFDSSATFDDRIKAKVSTISAFSKNQILPDWTSQVMVSQSQDKGSNITRTGTTRFDTRQQQVSWQNNISVFTTDVVQLIAEHRREEVDSSTSELNRSRTTNSIAAGYQLKRGAHLAAASIRNDNSSQFGSHATGSLSYGYRLTNALRASASIGTSFRAPSFNDLYFPGYGLPDNKPEKGRNAEAGLYYEDGKSTYSAVVYRNRLTDLLVFVPNCPRPGSTALGCAENVNEAVISGLTLGARTAVGSFNLGASLDFQNPKDETTGRQLARRAKRHGTLSLDHTAGKLTTGGDIVFSAERFDDANNRNRLGGYGIVNLYANYEVAPNWSLFARWNNVLDKDYELARNYNTAGSNVFVGLRYGIR